MYKSRYTFIHTFTHTVRVKIINPPDENCKAVHINEKALDFEIRLLNGCLSQGNNLKSVGKLIHFSTF